jgi:hypothetical protein
MDEGRPEVCHAQWHEGVTGILYMDCCDSKAKVTVVWHALNRALALPDGTSLLATKPSSPAPLEYCWHQIAR